MKTYFKVIGIIVAIIITVSGFVFVGSTLGWMGDYFILPKVEQVRYNTFKQSQTYNDGMLRDLQDLKMQYMSANPDQQAALKAIIIQRFSVYPMDRMPPDLQSFYYSINQGTPQ